jgi:RimJ/RimL family protein N-acetyltransferase
MLHELEKSEFHRVLPLFQGYLQDPMMYAVIEGHVKGRVFADDTANPGAAFVWTGTECAYLAGGEDSSRFKQALHQLVVQEIIPAAQAGGRDFLSLFSFPASYAHKLENLFSAQVPLRTPLSTFSFDEQRFHARHGGCQKQLTGAFTLERIGAEELANPQNAHLSGEIAAYWGMIDSFLNEGIGYCVLDGENLVSWCYVQAYGHGAQTIDIWTASSHRRRGLGTLVAAAVIDSSLAEGYSPFWICDKANLGSRELAEWLGFEYINDIFLVDIPFQPYDFYRGLAEHFFMPQGEYRQAAESYDRAFSVQQGTAKDYYNAALGWASAGEGDRALEYLQRAIENGWNDMGRIESEQAFAALRGMKEWENLKGLGD